MPVLPYKVKNVTKETVRFIQWVVSFFYVRAFEKNKINNEIKKIRVKTSIEEKKLE